MRKNRAGQGNGAVESVGFSVLRWFLSFGSPVETGVSGTEQAVCVNDGRIVFAASQSTKPCLPSEETGTSFFAERV